MNLIFFRKFPKRVLVLVAGILALLLLSGGVFLFLNREIKGKPSDYVIKDTVQGKIIENKRAGFSAQVPDQWEAKRIEVEEGGLVFYSSDSTINWKDSLVKLPLEKGCMIRNTVVYKKADLQQIKEDAKELHFMLGQKYEKFEILEINGFPTLKDTFETEEWGKSLSIYMLYKDKVYSFHAHWGDKNEDRCVQEFNKFLETVVID
jgi:hypothetical protein